MQTVERGTESSWDPKVFQISNSSRGSDKKIGEYGADAGREGLREMLRATVFSDQRLQYL